MNIAVDLGNTFVKAGFFEGVVLKRFIQKATLAEVIDLIKEKRPENLIVGSVGMDPEILLKEVPPSVNSYIADYTLKTPIINNYKTPTTLGIDRLAGVVGANSLYPSTNCLVVDAGTCIKYDIIDSDNVYQGGAISPGLTMKFNALHNFTARLPLVEIAEEAPLLGKNTQQSIQSGVINGSVSEIEEMIRKFSARFPNLKTIICGGDAKFFESKIKAPIFVVPELVLIGLNRILLYNVSSI